jgi:hypothetical protein
MTAACQPLPCETETASYITVPRTEKLSSKAQMELETLCQLKYVMDHMTEEDRQQFWEGKPITVDGYTLRFFPAHSK